MTQPKQPEDHPAPEDMDKAAPTRDPTGVAPNGVPPEATSEEATAYPTSDRQATEVAAHPDKHKG